jgi:hypothetical protein
LECGGKRNATPLFATVIAALALKFSNEWEQTRSWFLLLSGFVTSLVGNAGTAEHQKVQPRSIL